MPELTGQHGYLSAMVRVMRNEVAKEAHGVGFETLYFAITVDGQPQSVLDRLPAVLKRFDGLLLSHGFGIEFRGKVGSARGF